MTLEQMQNNVRQDIINELPIEAEGYLSKEFTDSVVAATWKAGLNSILESGLLEEKKIVIWPQDLDIKERIAHNTLARAIKEFISNMDTKSVDSIHSNKQANQLMKTTSLPSVQEVYETTLTKEDDVSIPNLLTQDREQAYTSLIEGIEGMRKVFDGCELADHDRTYLAALTDILENVVKPLYGKIKL